MLQENISRCKTCGKIVNEAKALVIEIDENSFEIKKFKKDHKYKEDEDAICSTNCLREELNKQLTLWNFNSTGGLVDVC